jgi:hypothetical protein
MHGCRYTVRVGTRQCFRSLLTTQRHQPEVGQQTSLVLTHTSQFAVEPIEHCLYKLRTLIGYSVRLSRTT